MSRRKTIRGGALARVLALVVVLALVAALAWGWRDFTRFTAAPMQKAEAEANP